MKFEQSYDKPINEIAWNNLCLVCDNFVQTTNNDKAQNFYKQQAIYFQIFDDSSKLIAGSKFYLSQNKRKILRHLNKDLLQFGEFIFDSTDKIESYRTLLLENLAQFLKKEKIVKYSCGNFYGNPSLLLKLEPKHFSKKIVNEFNIARVDLRTAELLPSFNRNTRRNIKKAEENELKNTFENNNIEDFRPFLIEIYSQQGNLEGCPNLDYVRQMHNNILDQIGLTFCNKKKQLLSAVLCINYGKSVYSVFGGTLKNDFGSGQFMYYKLMQRLQNEGFEYYYFGQIAKEDDSENKKFSVGISTFKRGFNCEEIAAEKNTFILKPIYLSIWNFLVKILVRN